MFGMKQLTWEAIIHTVTQESRACPLPSLLQAASSRHIPIPCSCNLTALTLSRPGAILTTPLTSLRLLQLHAPHANVPLWPPRAHAPHSLVTRPPPSSAWRWHLTPLTTPKSHAPHASHTNHGAYAPCATHAHLLSSSPPPFGWQEVMWAGLLKTFASGMAPQLDLAPLGQAGGGSSLEILWTLPTPAPKDWGKRPQVECGREDMCS